MLNTEWPKHIKATELNTKFIRLNKILITMGIQAKLSIQTKLKKIGKYIWGSLSSLWSS